MIQNKNIIVITGGIATGKSTVTNHIRERGYEVIDSDNIVHNLYKKGNSIYLSIIRMAGIEILDERNEIDRAKLAKFIFSSENIRKEINALVHKAVIEKINEEISKTKGDTVFVDIPLMLEEKDNLINFGLAYDQIWLVYTTRELQIERLFRRDKRDKQESMKILDAQMDIEKKRNQVDIIIENTKSVETLKQQVDTLLELKNKKELTIGGINETN
ncbi:MAG: Dephospho-CoA kinase [Clostridiales bacterium 38_11]|nr:MAG: Dephospho-CoA kinase [Clostridiales bacterium 38_11]HBH12510.1 dephospho-CoA kinase [Clostridiales bacterium]